MYTLFGTLVLVASMAKIHHGVTSLLYHLPLGVVTLIRLIRLLGDSVIYTPVCILTTASHDAGG